jgi:hypothetical protein
MKRKIALTICFGFMFNIGFSQNKKEQIEALNYSIDSLKTVLKSMNSNYSDSLVFERSEKSKKTLENEKQQKKTEDLMLHSKNLDSQISSLSDANSVLKKEIEELKIKQKELSTAEIPSFVLYKNKVNNYLVEHYKKELFKFTEVEKVKDPWKNSNSELYECRIWWQGDIAYALVIVKDTKMVTAEFDDGLFPEMSLNYYILKYSNGKFEKEYSWCETVNVCPVDSDNNNIDFQITDLNNDGKFETWCVNENYCLGGVDPTNLNIYMYENGNLYLMKSVTNIPNMEITDIEIKEWIQNGDATYSINKFDSKFQTISDQYRKYAIKIRNENILGEGRFNFSLD